MKTEIDHNGKFLSFRRKVNGQRVNYEYVHEDRCDGHIVSILPVDVDNNQMLLRRELTPCWQEDDKEEVHFISSITGGWEKDIHATPIDTVVDELREEAGIKLLDADNQIITLGTCRGTKSSDTIYHLFVVLLNTFQNYEMVKTEPDGDLEVDEYCQWYTGPVMDSHLGPPTWMNDASDPMLFVLWSRYMMCSTKLARREDYV